MEVSARPAQGTFGLHMSLGTLPATAAKVPKPETAALWANDHRWKLLEMCGFYLCQQGLLLWPPFSAGGPFNFTPSHYFLLWFREMTCLSHTFQIPESFTFPVLPPSPSSPTPSNSSAKKRNIEKILQNKKCPQVWTKSGIIYTWADIWLCGRKRFASTPEAFF